jgi:hypothetical protein
MRPDRSIRTFWREQPDENDLNDPGLEVVLPGAAQLMHLNPGLLEPNVLPGLWNKSEIIVKDIIAYFSGGHVVKIPKEGYDEQIIIPRADRPIIENAIRLEVEKGQLWLRSGPGSILNEEIPEGLLSDDALISKPPSPINVSEILPENLPEAWKNDTTTALAISVNLSKKIGITLPWITIRTVIDSAIRARHLEVSPGSISWPCEFSEAKKMKIQLSKEKPLPPIKKLLTADAELRADQIQDFAEKIGDIKRVTAGIDLKFKLHIEIPEDAKPSKELLEKLNKILQDIDSKLEIN